jgi:hypothetical protein
VRRHSICKGGLCACLLKVDCSGFCQAGLATCFMQLSVRVPTSLTIHLRRNCLAKRGYARLRYTRTDLQLFELVGHADFCVCHFRLTQGPQGFGFGLLANFEERATCVWTSARPGFCSFKKGRKRCWSHLTDLLSEKEPVPTRWHATRDTRHKMSCTHPSNDILVTTFADRRRRA